jgi:acyl-CoA synthetase (AMP-forming)/AMP-acid ligase II
MMNQLRFNRCNLLNLAVNDALQLLMETLDLQLYCIGEPTDVSLPEMAKSLEPMIAAASNQCNIVTGRGYRDTLFYIYTSGTTGLPKASRIRHCRVFMAAYGVSDAMGLSGKDILYTPLPFYHASGGILGSCPMLFLGTTIVTRRKFSATRFWTDCIRYDCTASIYIGELCRYLLNQPERPEERQHRVRLIFGNGLRPNLWKPMRERFHIKSIVEFFGSTEGNTTLSQYSFCNCL